jgi:dynein heavy chain
LSSQVVTIFNEFITLLEAFKKIKYDILDLKSILFEEDLNKFSDKMDDLDKRIA